MTTTLHDESRTAHSVPYARPIVLGLLVCSLAAAAGTGWWIATSQPALTDEPEIEGKKLITSFEHGNPFRGGTVVAKHATQGKHALRMDRNYVVLAADLNWTGFAFLKADVFNEGKSPLPVTIEIHDKKTRDYWTRVNYTTVAPPGASTLIVPTSLYVGEKSRPGRALELEAISKLAIDIGDEPPAALFVDNLRLERDTQTPRMLFEGLLAFDVGPDGSPLMDGFTRLGPSVNYNKQRGYGWKGVRIWRSFDVLQPDPLYQDFVCVEQGGLAIDLPNGTYQVFVNMDSPSGYWGEYQRYRRRALILEGVAHEDTMDLGSFKRRYFRHWNKDDLPSDNTFERYQDPYFQAKFYRVDVNDGQLNIEFDGENWACCVSTIVVFPDAKGAEGRRFLEYVRERRRFYFDNAFKRVLSDSEAKPPRPTNEEDRLGFVLFSRDYMKDVHSNDCPGAAERQIVDVGGAAFAGEYEPVTLSIYPLRDLGMVTASVTNLQGPGNSSIPATSIDIGYVQHRITRVTEEGSVYTIRPRLIMPYAGIAMPAGVTRTFWLTVKVPAQAPAGLYHGVLRIASAKGGTVPLPFRFTVLKGTLDPVDIPAGPWGHRIELPWFDDEIAAWNDDLTSTSLKKLREYGFTTASGLPELTLEGFRNGVPQIDFSRGDTQMKMFQQHGFRMPVVTYCPFGNLDLYYRDEDAMRDAGFSDYAKFIKSIFSAVQTHADNAGWLPVYWNIGDEPLGDDLPRAIANAESYRQAFPKGPPWFTAASSFKGSDKSDGHFRLSKALHVANWNAHDAAGVKLLRDAGGRWAFYNGGNRWTYGVYMYKAAKQYDMKFRIAWHWNAAAGDPYYALDCREDDYAWCNVSPAGELIPAVDFERLREGLDDYRRLLTLRRLAREQAGTAAADAANTLADDLLASFALGEREIPSRLSFTELRARLDAAIEKLRQ